MEYGGIVVLLCGIVLIVSAVVSWLSAGLDFLMLIGFICGVGCCIVGFWLLYAKRGDPLDGEFTARVIYSNDDIVVVRLDRDCREFKIDVQNAHPIGEEVTVVVHDDICKFVS